MWHMYVVNENYKNCSVAHNFNTMYNYDAM